MKKITNILISTALTTMSLTAYADQAAEQINRTRNSVFKNNDSSRTTNCLLKSGQVPRGTTVIRFTYGSEKKKWLYDEVRDFNNAQQNGESTPATYNGQDTRVCVEAIPKGSGDSVNEIKDAPADIGPQQEVHITAPASSVYVKVANHEAGKDILKLKNSMATSKLVIAMWESVARSFGKPLNEISWQDVLTRANQDESFRFGHTTPFRSASGLLATTAQFNAGAVTEGLIKGRKGKLKLDHVNNDSVKSFVSSIQKKIAFYGSSTGFYADKMLKDGKSNLSAGIIYENLVWEKNDIINKDKAVGGTFANREKLIAIYPKEGTFVTDHMFALVNREWVDPIERASAERFIEHVMSETAQLNAMKYGFAPGDNSINKETLESTVYSADNGFLPEAGRTEVKKLRTPEVAVIAQIKELWKRLLKRDAKVRFLVDVSGSMFNDERNGEVTTKSRMHNAAIGLQIAVDYLKEFGQKNEAEVTLFSRGRSKLVSAADTSRTLISTHIEYSAKANVTEEVEVTIPNKGCGFLWLSACTELQKQEKEVVIRKSHTVYPGDADTTDAEVASLLKAELDASYPENKGLTEGSIESRSSPVYDKQTNINYTFDLSDDDQVKLLKSYSNGFRHMPYLANNQRYLPSQIQHNNVLKRLYLDSASIAGGNTYMYDSIETVYREMCANQGSDKIEALVVLTDGSDSVYDSKHSLERLRSRVGFTLQADAKCKIPVFGLAYVNKCSREGQSDCGKNTSYYKTLKWFTGATSGTAGLGSNEEEIRKAFDKIATFF